MLSVSAQRKQRTSLSGRLISAQEDERSRLARELHDDVTQRLASARDRRRRSPKGGQSKVPMAMPCVQCAKGLTQLSEDVHALSYRLHPSILEDLGLIEALKNRS